MKSFSDESMVVFKEGEHVLNTLCKTKSGLLFLEKSGVLNFFKEFTKNSSIQRFRIYELISNISNISKESFKYVFNLLILAYVLKVKFLMIFSKI